MRLPVVPLVFLFIFSFLIDLYIWGDVRKKSKKKESIIFWASSLICYALLIVAISLPRRDTGQDLSTILWLLFTYLSIYIAKFGYFLISLIGRFLAMAFRTPYFRFYFNWVGVFVGIAFLAIMWIGVGYTRHHIMIVNQEVYSEKLPESFEDYKIVQISDLHVGTWGEDTSFIKKLVDSVNNLHPDLIVFTGDIVNRQTGEIEPFINVLSGLKSKDGVYSVLGNHDYGDYADWTSPAQREENNRRLAKYQSDMGWKLLNNERLFISNGKDSIMLIGVENWGDPPFPTYGNLEKALPSSPDSLYHQNDSTYKILLSHNPAHWVKEVSKTTNIDLTLSGHTHGMQTVLKAGSWKWSPGKYRYEEWGGKYMGKNLKGEPTQIYVNIGAGEVGMPARLMAAYPEITVLTLKKGTPR